MHPRQSHPRPAAAALVTLILSLFVTPPLRAQQSSQDWLESCRARNERNGRATHCELREATLAARGRLEVSARPNGGIEVTGSNRSDVAVTARVQAWADTDAEARALAQQVEVRTSGGRIDADGPSLRGERRAGWSVSFVVSAPRRQDLELGTVNGGVRVRGVQGDLALTTTNGGISMDQVGGRVRARTTNGSLDLRLANGSAFDNLDLETTNGAITVSVPANFAANLHARTVNGGFRTEFPVTVQGRLGRIVDAEIGGGGPPVRLTTTNGAIELRRDSGR